MKDFDRTIISQYQNSAILTQLITNLNVYLDPSANLDSWYNLVWHIDTAQGHGLDVWGRIVGIASRTIPVPAGSYFGFGEAHDRTGFNQSPFYAGQPTISHVELTDQAFRTFIFAKAAANITNCSIPAINQILRNLFPNRGNTYVTDGANTTFQTFFGFGEAGDRGTFGGLGSFIDNYTPIIPRPMTMTYVFNFMLQPFELSIVQSGILPKPTGVLVSTMINIPPSMPFIPTSLAPASASSVHNVHFIGRYTPPQSFQRYKQV